MTRILARIWSETDGVLSFEWTLLLTLVTIGVISGLAGARDGIVDELGDVAEAAQAIDQSYSLSDFDIPGVFENNPSVYTEGAEDNVYIDCARTSSPGGQGALFDS